MPGVGQATLPCAETPNIDNRAAARIAFAQSAVQPLPIPTKTGALMKTHHLIPIIVSATVLWLVGCSRSASDQARLDTAINGWKCLYGDSSGLNALDQIGPDVDPEVTAFCRQYPALVADAQAYIKKFEADHTPPAPPHVFLDIFAVVQGTDLYESPSGEHAIKYQVDVKGQWTDDDYVYLLVYDAAGHRTNVYSYHHPHPSRGFGRREGSPVI